MVKKGSEVKTVTEKVAAFSASLKYKDIPKEVVAISRNALLDWLGVTIAGSREEGVRILSQYGESSEAKKEATAICQGYMTTAELASLVNGNMGHALDFDDTFPISVHYNMHPSAVVVPATLAAAEKCKVSGRKLVTGYVVGMEVMYRVGDAIASSIAGTGWHPTPVIGSLGCAVACANVMGLDQIKTQNAIGIAASLAGGLLKNFGSMTKPMHAGNAARNGVLAAELASKGFTSNSNIFEGDFSFSQMFGSKEIAGLMGTESDLGKEWKLASVGIGFKPYPSCRSTHTSIDATIYLKKKFNIAAEQVAEIICKISPIHTRICRFQQPENGYQGKFSIPYCVATALRKGTVSLDDFTDDRVRDTEARELISKVKFVYPAEQDNGAMELTSEITIGLKNGSRYSNEVSLPKGEPENPMSDEEIAAKFESCASLILNKKDVYTVLNSIRKIEEIEDLAGLFKALRKTNRLINKMDGE